MSCQMRADTTPTEKMYMLQKSRDDNYERAGIDTLQLPDRDGDLLVMKHFLPFATLLAVSPLLVCCTVPSEDSSADTNVASQKSGKYWSHHVAVGHDVSYGDDPQQTLDLFLQGDWVGEPTFFDRAAEPRPTLLFIHGGGWVVADRRPETWAYPFLERGWHVVSIQYRLGPGTAPVAVDDAVCALNWVVKNADALGFDREKIVVAGASAGGHLALTTGTLGSRPGHDCYPGNEFRVHSVINWFGITDIEAVANFLDTLGHDFGNYARIWIGDQSVAEISAAYSPLHLVHADSPPVLTIHGTDDTVVPHDQAVVLHERLDELGVRNELLSLQGGKHAGFTDAQFQQAFGTIISFVETQG